MDDVGVRVGDSDRWAVDARLQQAVGEGRLTLAEYEERTGEVWRARTRGELEATTRDLPARVAAPAATHPSAGRRTRRAIAVMSGDELRGPVAPGQDVEAYALMGGAVVDLRPGALPAQVHVRAVAVMGGIEVLVPRGVTVHLTGLAFMGGRDLRIEDARPGAPVVHVSAWALMGGVEVKHGNRAPEVGDAGAPAQGEPQAYAGPVSAGSVALPAHGLAQPPGPGHPRRRRRTRRFAAAAWLAALLVGGGYVATRSDAAAVFGSAERDYSSVTQDVDVDAAALFGSVTIVVPDDARVSMGGLMVFGSSQSDVDGARTGPVIEVDALGAFGSVEVVTASQAARDSDD